MWMSVLLAHTYANSSVPMCLGPIAVAAVLATHLKTTSHTAQVCMHAFECMRMCTCLYVRMHACVCCTVVYHCLLMQMSTSVLMVLTTVPIHARTHLVRLSVAVPMVTASGMAPYVKVSVISI